MRWAIESGLVGFLLKDAPADQLAVAIRSVMAGERDVLRASLDGTSIAAQLFLSEGTVHNHVSAAIKKPNVHSRRDAAHLA